MLQQAGQPVSIRLRQDCTGVLRAPTSVTDRASCHPCASESAVVRGFEDNLEKASQQTQAEIHERASQLAKLHERRDREIVEIQRYEAVQGLVYQEPGVNRFQVHPWLHKASASSQRMQSATGQKTTSGMVAVAAHLQRVGPSMPGVASLTTLVGAERLVPCGGMLSWSSHS